MAAAEALPLASSCQGPAEGDGNEASSSAAHQAMVTSLGSGRFHRLDASQPSGAQVIEIAASEISSASGSATRRILFCSTGAAKERRAKLNSLVAAEGLDIGQVLLWLWSGSPFSGVLCMGLSAFAYALVSVFVEVFYAPSIPVFEAISIRCAVVASASFLLLKLVGVPVFGSCSSSRALLCRAAVGFLAMCGFLYSIRSLAVPDATLLSFASPLMASLAARIILKERIRTQELGGAACSCFGLLLLLQPKALFGELGERQGIQSFAAVPVGLVAAFLSGLSVCLVRSIGKAGESPLVVVFTFALFCWPAAALCSATFESFALPSFFELSGMVGIGLLMLIAQLLAARALQLDKVSRATCLQYTEAVAVLLLETVFLGRQPSLLSMAGALLVLGAVAFSVMWGSSDESSKI